MACKSDIPPISKNARIFEVTEDLKLVMEVEGRRRTLKLCGIVPTSAAKGYIEEAIAPSERVSLVHFGNLADVFWSKDGEEFYLNGLLVLEGLAEVNREESPQCSDPTGLETAEKLREKREEK
ncbi:MAG: hypothetical protein J7647_26940 [Cyanobacteria bacterium SBLK]|nr:hypothetical protein [Cyanobacteria bacterium SBLK]